MNNTNRKKKFDIIKQEDIRKRFRKFSDWVSEVNFDGKIDGGKSVHGSAFKGNDQQRKGLVKSLANSPS